MKRQPRRGSRAALVFCTLALSARAEVFVTHPLVFRSVPRNTFKADMKAVAAAWPKLLAKSSKASVIDGQAALSAMQKTDCQGDAACLSQLAQKAKALYSMYAVFDVVNEQLVLTASVIREDGQVVDKSVSVQLEVAAGFDVLGVRALNALLEKLRPALLPTRMPARSEGGSNLAQTPTSKTDSVKPPPALTQPSAQSAETTVAVASPTLADSGPFQKNAVPVVVLVAGAATAAAGTVLAVLGQNELAALKPEQGNITTLPEGVGDAAAVAEFIQSAQLKRTLGFVGLGAGIAAAVVGTVLLVKQPATANGSVGFNFAVSPSGAAVSLSGRF